MPRDFAGYLQERAGPSRRDLTGHELEVLAFLSQGARLTDVARMRGVTFYTVRQHARSARDKLAAKNLPHAVAIALRHGLID